MSMSNMSTAAGVAVEVPLGFTGGAPVFDRTAEQTLLIQKVADLRGLVANVESFLAAAVLWKEALASFGAVCISSAQTDMKHLPATSAPVVEALRGVGTLLQEVKASQSKFIQQIVNVLEAASVRRNLCGTQLEINRKQAETKLLNHEKTLVDFLQASKSKAPEAAKHLINGRAEAMRAIFSVLKEEDMAHQQHAQMLSELVLALGNHLTDHLEVCAAAAHARVPVWESAQKAKAEADAWYLAGEPWKRHGSRLNDALSHNCAEVMRLDLERLIVNRISPKFSHIVMPGTPACPENPTVAACFSQAECVRAWRDMVPEFGTLNTAPDCIRAGYMYRVRGTNTKSRFGRKWVRRWFELTRSGLYYWSGVGEEGIAPGTRILLSPVGLGALALHTNVRDAEKRRYRIDLTTYDRKTIALQTEGPYEFAMWCEAFQRSQVPPSPNETDYSSPALPPPDCVPPPMENAPSPPKPQKVSRASFFRKSAPAAQMPLDMVTLPATAPTVTTTPQTDGGVQSPQGAAPTRAPALSAPAVAPLNDVSPYKARFKSNSDAAAAALAPGANPANDDGGDKSPGAASAASSKSSGTVARAAVEDYDDATVDSLASSAAGSATGGGSGGGGESLFDTVSRLQKENRACADCGAVPTTHVSVGLGVLLCRACGMAHTASGVSQTKPLSSPDLDDGDVFLALAVGNAKSNALWEGDAEEVEPQKIKEDAGEWQRRSFVDDKYNQSLFVMMDENMRDEAVTVERLMKAAAANDVMAALGCLARISRAEGANAVGPDGDTPLHRAAAAGALEVCALLVRNGAAVGTHNADGDTAQGVALARGHGAVADFLLEAAVTQASR